MVGSKNNKGFVPLVILFVVAAAGVFLLTNSNVHLNKDVKGLLIARGGDDSSSGSNESSGSSGGSGDSGSTNTTGGTSGSSNTGTSGGIKTAEPKETVEPKETSEPKETAEPTEVEGPEGENVAFSLKDGELEQEDRIATGTGVRKIQTGKITVNGFGIEQQDNQIKLTFGNTSTLTTFPISVDKNTGDLFVNTGTGIIQIRVLPDRAAQIAQASGISQIDKVELASSTTGENVVFNISGRKTGKLLGLIDINQPINTQVGAQTGNVIATDQSFLLRLLSPLIR